MLETCFFACLSNSTHVCLREMKQAQTSRYLVSIFSDDGGPKWHSEEPASRNEFIFFKTLRDLQYLF